LLQISGEDTEPCFEKSSNLITWFLCSYANQFVGDTDLTTNLHSGISRVTVCRREIWSSMARGTLLYGWTYLLTIY